MPKFPTYITPKSSELAKTGYYPKDVSPQAKQCIEDMLGMLGSPFARQAGWYKSNYKNVTHLARRAIGVWVYALENPNQFGGEVRNAGFQAVIHVVRELLQKHNAFSGRKYKVKGFNHRYITAAINRMLDGLMRDAHDQLKRKQGEAVPFWWRKAPRRTLHKGMGKGTGGWYRIERYYGGYE